MTRRLIAVVLALVCLAAACSSPTPTSTPTTAKPPAEAAFVIPAETTGISNATNDQSAPPAATDTLPTDVDESTKPVASPEQAPASFDDAAERLVGLFADDVTDEQFACIVNELSNNERLVTAGRNNSFNMLPLRQRADMPLLMFDCAPHATARKFISAVASADNTNFPEKVTNCLVDAITTSPAGSDIIIGFIALGDEQAVPAESRDLLIDTMVVCFPEETLLEIGSSEALNDPAFQEQMDLDCLAESGDAEALRPMWTAIVDNPGADFDELDPAAIEPMMTGMFSCLSMGDLIAAQAASNGLTLSPESVECIDSQLTDIDFVTAGDDLSSQQSIGLAVLRCVTPEEAAQLR